MKFVKIESREQWEDHKKKLREWCAKANAEMSQEDFQKMLEDALHWREQFPDRDSYIKYMREQIKQQFPDE